MLYFSLKWHSTDEFLQIFFFYGRSLEILLVVKFLLQLLGQFVAWLKNVYAIYRTADDHLEVYWMKPDLFDLLLSLMQEHQLVRNLGVFLFVLHRHVPDRKTVVFTGHSQDWLFIRLESYRCDGLSMPVKT